MKSVQVVVHVQTRCSGADPLYELVSPAMGMLSHLVPNCSSMRRNDRMDVPKESWAPATTFSLYLLIMTPPRKMPTATAGRFSTPGGTNQKGGSPSSKHCDTFWEFYQKCCRRENKPKGLVDLYLPTLSLKLDFMYNSCFFHRCSDVQLKHAVKRFYRWGSWLLRLTVQTVVPCIWLWRWIGQSGSWT